ncbi:reverse transcriptase [Trichonephila clavipes]|uniref:Reverse transcriptase n=1 Tax=Trichonephila clavipes TaxID=2585209 RepID=A0A8X6SKH7_TRICX|nr:reverse transcriptase [Trichonephila clavipes]
MTSNEADAIPEELKSCALETIEERYPANEWLHFYIDGSYLLETSRASAGWFWKLFEGSWPWERTPPTTECQTKIAELISYGWTAALQWVPSHVGIPSNERANKKAKQGVESTQPEAPLTLRRAKSIISTLIDKYNAMAMKTSFGKPWETGHCGPNMEAPGES